MRISHSANRTRPHRSKILVTGLLLWLSARSVGATPPALEIETGGMYFDLTEDFADTSGAYARGRMGPIGNDEWRTEVVHLDRFDDSGVFGAIGNVHQWHERVFSDLAVGSSNGGFFWPEFRLDAMLSYRWLDNKRLITSAGVTYFDAKDIHSDTGIRGEVLYYTGTPWVFQGGVTYNISEPGGVGSVSGFGVVSHVRDRQRIVSLRVGGGEQAYQPFASDTFQVDISFFTMRLSWKEWLGDNWGVNIAADSYHSTTYDQRGVEFGFFRQF